MLDANELRTASRAASRSDGARMLLVRREGEIYAIGEVCSHLGGPLAEGELQGDVIQCPWHGSRFCVRDGSVVDGPATHPQPVFETRLNGGRIEVRAGRKVEAGLRDLLHRDALRQIARLIDVAAAAHGDVVRQQLQRHDLQDRRQQFRGRRDLDDVVRRLVRLLVALRHHRDHDAFARLHFLNVGKRLLVQELALGARRDRAWRARPPGRFSSISALGPCFISPAG